MKALPLVAVLLLLTVPLTGQQRFTCVETLGSGGAFSLACTPVTTTPPVTTAPTITAFTADSPITAGNPSTLRWTLGGGAPTVQSIDQSIGSLPLTTRSHVVRPMATVTYTLTVSNTAGVARLARTVTVNPVTVAPIFGVLDPAIIGPDFTQAEHDRWAINGGDGFRYRTWHPQCPSAFPDGTPIAAGRCFAHEHGDNPANITQPDIVATLTAAPIMFGYIGRRMNDHDEPHEGFKVFTAAVGECNDEGRCNLTDSLSVFHMGTGGPKRAVTPHHSDDLRTYNPDSGLAHTRLMMETGGFDNVCDPRAAEPVKDGFSIPNRCKVNSGYEIWTTSQTIKRASGQVIGRPRAVPAVFDPITVFLRSDPTAVVYAWDDRFKPYRNFPGDDWTGNRGCERESYAQVGYWQNAGGPTVIYTDALGQEIAATSPLAIRQVVPSKNIVDHRSSTPRPGEAAGNQAFKIRKNYCGQKSKLGLKN